ncbi:hypothetical protein QBC46DRAFT_432030, partial [Diplogelasinospora grovesii]
WPSDKHRLRVRFLDGSTWERDEVKHLITKHYHSIPMRIRFEFLKKGSTGPSDIRINFTDESKSYIGRDAENYPDKPTMWLNMHPNRPSTKGKRWKRQADVLHEFGHALGMVHEQQHPDCRANWDYRVLQAKHGWDAQKVHRNYKKVDALKARLTPYDPESIMHYGVTKGDTKSQNMEVPQNNVLSEGDKRFLMAIYPVEQIPRPKTERKREPKSTKKSDKSLVP